MNLNKLTEAINKRASEYSYGWDKNLSPEEYDFVVAVVSLIDTQIEASRKWREE